MAKDMRNGAILLLLCNIAFFISQFHFAYTTTNPSSYSNSNNVTCIESERRALLELKASLVDSTSRLATWTAAEDCCNWAGITCNPHTGYVQKLHLRNPIQLYQDEYDPEIKKDNLDSYHNNSLGGEINPSILNLEHLTYLDLSCNDFSGIQIPTFLGSLKNLRYLNFSYAGFGGEIPSHLGNLSKLQYLDLGFDSIGNSLTVKSLNWIVRLTSLKALDLSDADLTACVDCLYYIGMIPSLSSLSLRGCAILVGTAISPDLSPIVNLTFLVSLDLGENQLMSNSSVLLPLLNLSSQLVSLKLDDNSLQSPIPIKFEKLTALTVLDLSGNYFNSSPMPQSLCNHTSLVYLALRHDQLLQGSLPHCLGNLTSLKVLDLAGNNFRGKIPNELGYLKQLTTLDLSGNQLGGIVPATLGQLTKLQKLDISFNSLTGELSESHFEKLKSLKYLSISNNYFLSVTVNTNWTPPFQLQVIQMDSVLLGSFPPWLQTQRYVVKLSMNNASISGVFPTLFSSWSSINTLHLANNKIQGSSISFPPRLRELDISNNLLTGALSLHTNYLSNMSLEYFNLNNNHLAGDISHTFCNLRFLYALSLANNQLIGRIPLCFGNLSSLVFLSLANNQLTGRIPLSFGNLSSLFILSVANNHLTGRIPSSFGNLRGLAVLDLSNNSFSGHIPSTLGNLTSLCVLHLSRNNLSGVLPSSLKNLKSLRTLDLRDNQLAGTIPEWIGTQFSSLQFLLLESNNFYGDISMHLCQLSFLKILNLADNNLDGHIPRCFDNLTMMRSKEGHAPFVGFSNTYSAGINDYSETLWNVMKGVELEYSTGILNYAIFISLSTNKLQGEIPNELLDLEGLQSLNLSDNKLSGRIPENIGKLKNLESLDLAMNQLSGSIPQSLANIDSLSYLNLSFNNLAGRIPSGSHFDTLSVDQSIYEGNSGLCGKPLAKSCPDDGTSEGKGLVVHEDIDEGFELLWLFAGMAPGFAVGSVGVLCILYFKESWHDASFRFVENCFCNVRN